MSTDIDGGFDFISAIIDADVALTDLQPSDSDTTLRSSEAQETAIREARIDEAYLLKRRYVDIEVDEEVYIPAIEKVFVDRIAELKAQLAKERKS